MAVRELPQSFPFDWFIAKASRKEILVYELTKNLHHHLNQMASVPLFSCVHVPSTVWTGTEHLAAVGPVNA